LRRAWLDRKQRATSVKQELRWKRRAARLGRKPAFGKMGAPVEVPAEAPREKIPEAGKVPEKARPEEKTEIPRSLFPE